MWLMLCALVVAVPLAAADKPPEFYEKCGSLQQTMLNTRARLQQWRAEQRELQRTVQAGPWYGATAGNDVPWDPSTTSRLGPQIASTQTTSGPTWKSLAPSWNPWTTDPLPGIFSVEPLPADYLATTLHADQPVTLTFELSRYEWFGGFAYRPPESGAGVQVSDALIWLNGQPVPLHNRLAGYERVPVAKRRSWHERFNWHEAILVDLNLQPGENHLVVSLHKPGRKPWFNCVRFSSEPTTALWSLIEHDFPRSGHQLLEHVDASWFNVTDGWLSEGDTPQLERQVVEGLAEKLGTDGAAIRGQLAVLLEAHITSSDIRWLDLCVSAAELHAALSQAASLRAAVAALAAAYPHQYRGHELLDRVDRLRDGFLMPTIWTRPRSQRRAC